MVPTVKKYSDSSVVVFGKPDKAIRESFKTIGGKFVQLPEGPGWIFCSSLQDKVKALCEAPAECHPAQVNVVAEAIAVDSDDDIHVSADGTEDEEVVVEAKSVEKKAKAKPKVKASTPNKAKGDGLAPILYKPYDFQGSGKPRCLKGQSQSQPAQQLHTFTLTTTVTRSADSCRLVSLVRWFILLS